VPLVAHDVAYAVAKPSSACSVEGQLNMKQARIFIARSKNSEDSRHPFEGFDVKMT
jgi:hypothetical protein